MIMEDNINLRLSFWKKNNTCRSSESESTTDRLPGIVASFHRCHRARARKRKLVSRSSPPFSAINNFATIQFFFCFLLFIQDTLTVIYWNGHWEWNQSVIHISFFFFLFFLYMSRREKLKSNKNIWWRLASREKSMKGHQQFRYGLVANIILYI